MARQVIVDALPDLAEVLLKQAKTGSLPHLKLTLDWVKMEKPAAKKPVKPPYSQRVERQLLQELEDRF